MAAVNFAQLTGDFKEAYASKIADNISDVNLVTRMTKLEKGERQLGK